MADTIAPEPVVVEQPAFAQPEPVVAAEPVLHTDVPTAVGIESETEVKPVETAASEPVKPVEPAKEPEPVVAAEPVVEAEPVAYEFKWPEGMTVDEKSLAPAVELFREHNVDPETAQKFMDLHSQAMKQLADAMPKQNQRVFLDTRKAWLDEAKADPIIGGAAWDTTVKSANDVLANTALLPKSDRAAFNAAIRATGIGDHPQFIKFLTRINTFFREPVTPPPALTPPRANGAQSGSRRSAILDHPTSRPGT